MLIELLGGVASVLPELVEPVLPYDPSTRDDVESVAEPGEAVEEEPEVELDWASAVAVPRMTVRAVAASARRSKREW